VDAHGADVRLRVVKLWMSSMAVRHRLPSFRVRRIRAWVFLSGLVNVCRPAGTGCTDLSGRTSSVGVVRDKHVDDVARRLFASSGTRRTRIGWRGAPWPVDTGSPGGGEPDGVVAGVAGWMPATILYSPVGDGAFTTYEALDEEPALPECPWSSSEAFRHVVSSACRSAGTTVLT
jgi:hypothetical protein